MVSHVEGTKPAVKGIKTRMNFLTLFHDPFLVWTFIENIIKSQLTSTQKKKKKAY